MADTKNIILFPDYKKLQETIDKLRTEISILVFEKDELELVECKNIEMAYTLIFGSLEYKAYEAQCVALRLKRKTELIQAKLNCQAKIILSQIDTILDNEFADYQTKLTEQLQKMNEAIKRNKSEILSDKDNKELKKLYRRIVKILHPDLNPDLNEAQINMFENAISAYKNGDLLTLKIIDSMVSEPELLDTKHDSMKILEQEKERLAILLQHLKDSIVAIKSQYPYTVKEFIQDADKQRIHKAELENILQQYKASIAAYSKKIKELLG